MRCMSVTPISDWCVTLAHGAYKMIPVDSWDGELGELHPRVVDPTHRLLASMVKTRLW